MYSNNSRALRTYQRAYDRLIQEEVAQKSIDMLFAPETPAVLPVFLPNPLVSEETTPSAEFIEAAFEITRFGRSRQIEIVDETANVTEEDRDRLIDLIRNRRFRPRTKGGSFDQASPVVVRYYVSE
jgi:hypothetical protein